MANKDLIDVVVTAKVAKFRRAGMLWTGDPTPATVTPEILAILQGEKMLFVEVLTPMPAAKVAKNEAT
ncbi:MAG: hypothetical protein PHP00_06840 [Thiotrichaceae bacterium]|nr:hypothetical protein [Thiotrichaceae bacterium]